MDYCQRLSNEVNMPYSNITLDDGAAINAFKYLWSNNDTFSNAVIHLRDFHFMTENFKVKILKILQFVLGTRLS